jgi:hypothetical protein
MFAEQCVPDDGTKVIFVNFLDDSGESDRSVRNLTKASALINRLTEKSFLVKRVTARLRA